VIAMRHAFAAVLFILLGIAPANAAGVAL